MLDASATVLETALSWLTGLTGWQATLLVGGVLLAIHEIILESVRACTA